MLILLAGCREMTEQRLVGKWRAAKPDSINRKVGDDEAAESPKMTIEFSSSGKLTTTTRMGKIDSIKTGTWKSLVSDEAAGPIRIECQIGMQSTTHEIDYQGGTISWIPPNLAGTKQKILFVRVEN